MLVIGQLVLLVLCGIGIVLFIDACGEGSFGCEVKGHAAISCDELRRRAKEEQAKCKLAESLSVAKIRREGAGW